MNLKEWKKLPESQQRELCNKDGVSPYADWNFFKEVEDEFIKVFGNQPMIGEVHCSLGPGLGPYNSINVAILRGKGRSKIPKYFLGFPVTKLYQKEGRPDPVVAIYGNRIKRRTGH